MARMTPGTSSKGMVTETRLVSTVLGPWLSKEEHKMILVKSEPIFTENGYKVVGA